MHSKKKLTVRNDHANMFNVAKLVLMNKLSAIMT